MDRHVLVPLLKAVVLADVMQVVASDHNRSLHLHFGHHTCGTSPVCVSSRRRFHRARPCQRLSLYYISIAIRQHPQNPGGLEDHRDKTSFAE